MKADGVPSDTQATVSLRDGLGIRDAGRLSQELRAAIEAHRAVTIDTGALASVDVTILQVLIVAHKSARAAV